jgi:cytochrome c55X
MRAGYLSFVLMLLSLSASASEGVPFADQTIHETVRLVRQDCGSCHGMSLLGGLGTPLTREALAGQSAEALAVIILHGKHGTAMPPWKSLLSAPQAQWIAERLLEGFPEEKQP